MHLSLIDVYRCELPLRFMRFPAHLKLSLVTIYAVPERPPFLQRIIEIYGKARAQIAFSTVLCIRVNVWNTNYASCDTI